VDWYLKGFGRRHGLKTELQQEAMTDRLPPEIEAGVFRIVQEALTNVAKHARAISCRVFLQRLPHSLFVTVEDDGLGFDPAASRRGPRGLGLVGIRERVTRLNGQMRIETAPGKGTRLSVEVPVAAGEREALAG
jgi:two-component system sensor kinase